MTVLLFYPEEISRPVSYQLLLTSGRPEGQRVKVIERFSSVRGGSIDGLEA